jgi:hypothetical protein
MSKIVGAKTTNPVGTVRITPAAVKGSTTPSTSKK